MLNNRKRLGRSLSLRLVALVLLPSGSAIARSPRAPGRNWRGALSRSSLYRMGEHRLFHYGG